MNTSTLGRSLTSLLVGLTALIVFGGCNGNTSGPEDPPPEASDAFLVFVSERDGNRELYRIDPDGSDLQRLTNHPATDESPDCSPDGAQVVFQSDDRAGSQTDIYRISSDGDDLTRLTARQGTGENDFWPAWGPRGERIAFGTSERSQFSGDGRLALMSADGTNVRGVGDQFLSAGFELDWSPQGHGIAIAADVPPEEDGTDIVRVDTVGNVQVLTEDPTVSETQPNWSGTSDRLVYTRQRPDATVADLMTVQADGTDREVLVAQSTFDATPAWSPDGSRIAFTRGDPASLSSFDIHVADADGSDPRQVTTAPGLDFQPTWCAR